ncbi:MAG: glycosyltransferase family 2 protein [Caulobacteraceae bacterium]|nr:glycosyltransferase family 2 protein [Caulobacteraceae bacterium]
MTDATPPAPREIAGKRLSIIAPVHNEEPVLPLFYQRLREALDAVHPDYEIVCVNDGSRDASLAVMLAHRAGDPRIKIVNLSRNFGKEVALSAGLDACTGDLVVPIDVDLQDPPELIAEFIAKWREGYDVVYGVRVDRSADTALKRWTSHNFYRLFNRISDVPRPYNAGDCRLMDRRVVEVLKQLPERNRFMKGLFAWVGFRQVGVDYVRPARAAGQTSFRYWRLWNFALDGLTSFSSLPIRVWSYVGAAAGVGAVLAALALIARTLIHGRDVPGYPSIVVLILLSFGVQMLAIGALGEYVSRIYQEVKGRPLYVVDGRYGFD